METYGILENWSQRRGGRLQEVVATRGSTVFLIKAIHQFNFSISEMKPGLANIPQTGTAKSREISKIRHSHS